MQTYLALGDSYTIGEQVPLAENFPSQTVDLVNASSALSIAAPKIIAVTGWTTDELAAAIEAENIRDSFEIVSLLIGVNNQYRGRTVTNYKEEFTELLHKAIEFAGGKSNRVFVLSIPDWGVTPFAEGKDRQDIAYKIDEYNAAKKAITLGKGCHYIDITQSTRAHGTDETYLTPDKLHYSAKAYKIWAEALAALIVKELA